MYQARHLSFTQTLLPLPRYGILEEIEDALSCIKVIAFDQDSIRLSLTTYIPKFEDRPQKVEIAFGASQVNHELLIEVVDESIQLETAEVSFC